MNAGHGGHAHRGPRGHGRTGVRVCRHWRGSLLLLLLLRRRRHLGRSGERVWRGSSLLHHGVAHHWWPLRPAVNAGGSGLQLSHLLLLLLLLLLALLGSLGGRQLGCLFRLCSLAHLGLMGFPRVVSPLVDAWERRNRREGN